MDNLPFWMYYRYSLFYLNINRITLIDIIDTNLSIRTCSTNKFIVCRYFKRENFGVYITKEVNNSRFIIWILIMVEFELSRIEIFGLKFMLSMFKEMIPFFECDFLFDKRRSHL